MSQTGAREQLSILLRPEEGYDRQNCANCIAACCLRNTVLALTTPETEMMTGQGVAMRKLSSSESRGHKPGRGKEHYLLEEDCANLGTNEKGQRVCTIYDERPGVCREFKEGGYNCITFRNARMLQKPAANE